MYADHRDPALPGYVRELGKEKRRQWVAIANRLSTAGATSDDAAGKADSIVLGKKANEQMQARLARLAERRGESLSDLDHAAQQAATSPQNELPQPTEAQIRAGNYTKGHLNFHGLGVTIENPAGSTRSGKDQNGEQWEVTMSAHYGYLKRTVGADDEHIDCYIGPNHDSEKVYVINQHDAASGVFDEHKVVFGTDSLSEAIALYDAHFSDGKGALRRRGITQMTLAEFKDWLASGETKLRTASDPTASAVHVDGLMTSKTKPKSPHYLTKMCSMLAGRYTDAELKDMTAKARAHAGGMSKAERARMKSMLNDEECAELMGEDSEDEQMGEQGKACVEPLNCLKASESESVVSLTSRLRRIEQAFYEHFTPPGKEGQLTPARYWPQEVWDNHVIARASETDQLFKVPYQPGQDGRYLFGSPVEVVVHYEEKQPARQATIQLAKEFTGGDVADICANGHGSRLFVAYQFAEPPEWMPLLPKPGKYQHPEYGEIDITKGRNSNFCENFANGVYQSSLPINPEHQPDSAGAFGWVEELRLNEDGSVDARVKWTDRGTESIRNDRFRFISPEWMDSWTDALGKTFKDVLRGAALTVRPFFKDKFMRPLVASEDGLQLAEPGVETADKTQVFLFTALKPITLPAPEAGHHNKENPVMPNEDKGAAAPAVDAKAFAELQDKFTAMSERETQRDEQIKTLTEANTTATSTIKALSEDNAKLQADARQKRFNDEIKGRNAGGRPWHGDHAQHLTMLEKLTQAFGEDNETVKQYIAQQQAIAKQFAESDLFKEIGTDASAGAMSDDPTAQLNAKAEAYMASEAGKGKDFGEAFDHIMKDPANQALYGKHRGRATVDVNKRYGGTAN